jgi:hypothetical protein
LGKGKSRISTRIATAGCIRRIRAQAIRRTELEIDKKDLNADGMTEIGFATQSERGLIALRFKDCR